MEFKVLYPPWLHQHWHHPHYEVLNKIFSNWHRIQDLHRTKLVLYHLLHNLLAVTILLAITTTAIPIIQMDRILSIHGITVTMIPNWLMKVSSSSNVLCLSIVWELWRLEEVVAEAEKDTNSGHDSSYLLTVCWLMTWSGMFLAPKIPVQYTCKHFLKSDLPLASSIHLIKVRISSMSSVL